MAFVLHAAWLGSDKPVSNGQLFFWADDRNRPLPTDVTAVSMQPANKRPTTGRNGDPRLRSDKIPSYPSQISVSQLRVQLLALFPALQSQVLKPHSTSIWVPEQASSPFSAVYSSSGQQPRAGENSKPEQTGLRQWQITGLVLPPVPSLRLLCQLEQGMGRAGHDHHGMQDATEQQVSDTLSVPWRFGNDLLFWSNAAKFTLQLLTRQQYLPTLLQQSATRLYAGWQPVFLDAQLEQQFEQLGSIMPPVCRAYGLDMPSEAANPTELLSHFVTTLLDATIRSWIANNHSATPPQSQSQQWLLHLMETERSFDLPPQSAHQVYQTWRKWSEQLHIIRDANFRICFHLNSPSTDQTTNPAEDNWTLEYYLQARDQLHLTIAAAEVWATQSHTLHLGARLLDRPKERLQAGLAVAARVSPPIARSLQTPQPSLVHLTTAEAYTFLNDTAPLLESSGFGLHLPDWWYTNQRVRLGLRMTMIGDRSYQDSDNDAVDSNNISSAPTMTRRGRGPGYVRYDWELMLGDKPLSHAEFEQLTSLDTPLVHLRDQWIELDPNQVAAAQQFLVEQRTAGRISFLHALRIAQSHLGHEIDNPDVNNRNIREDSSFIGHLSTREIHLPDNRMANAESVVNDLLSEPLLPNIAGLLPIQSVDAQGWLAQALAQLHQPHSCAALAEPVSFVGELRPYQRRGVGWLNYLGQLGLGACLADDMGLGKTVQAIALLLHQGEDSNQQSTPNLLLCPTSVVANWRHEVERFAPSLRVLVHHGGNRLSGDDFVQALSTYDLVITSYGTARRDVQLLSGVIWHNLILDEAQNIKNPSAKQTKAVRHFHAHNRIALTGTPVENRLSELWSIMEFLNPGYLEGYERFRRRYVIPIERYNDEQQALELRNLVQPFLLRRLKSDPSIIADLPEKNEMVVYCSLTQEQATLYETVVSQSLSMLDQSDGIQRRGMVLALLTKLKQICNHPAHYLKEQGPIAGRSGKLNRLLEMMEEVIAVGDSALVFTQFVEMGELLQKHFTEHLKADVLFLHGRTTALQRDRMVSAFQEAETSTIFILSLRAGGSGLNLTKANHVFHFDRWWNPAVENQATDRAFRIGQRRDVQVHKFVVAGTLEEHIQQLLDDKQNLADTVVGSGEQWLSELNTEQLRDLLLLRRDERVVADQMIQEEEEEV